MGGLTMRISAASLVKNSTALSFKQNKSVDALSGLDVVKKYEQLRQKEEKEQEINNEKLNNVLYNSIFLMAQKGRYQDAKILYDAFLNNTDLTDDPDLNNTIGNVNKINGDIKQAQRHYTDAIQNLSNANNAAKPEIIKNYFETGILLGNEQINPQVFNDTSNPYINAIYLSLVSTADDFQNKPVQSANEIKAAYKIMKNAGYTDDSVILKTAFVLAEEGEYEKSNDIIIENLNRLKSQERVYTKEFVDYLLLLGINVFDTSEENTLNQSAGIFKNVAEIAQKTGLTQPQEIANYYIAKNLFLQNSDEFKEHAKSLLNTTKNKQYLINLNEMLGDFSAQKDTDAAAEYYKTAKSLIEDKETNKAKIFELCKKIKKVHPQESAQIDKEIDSLNAEELFNTHYLSKALMSLYTKNNFEKIVKISDNIIKRNEDKTHVNLAKLYSSLAKIHLGEDMEQCLKQADKAITELTIPAKNSSKKSGKDALFSKKQLGYNSYKAPLRKLPDNPDLQKSIYFAQKSKALILFDAMSYSAASNAINESDLYLNEDNYKKETVIKDQIAATLINYKAKDYYKAEQHALRYLELLLDKKFESTKPSQITKDVNEILIKKNDTEKRKIAAAYETLGLINLKNSNFSDSQEYFMCAVNIREKLKDKDFQLANSYAALARLAILNASLFNTKRPNSSKEMHNKCLEILKNKYPNNSITKEEEIFHKKYYGIKLASLGKYIKNPFSDGNKALIEKFKCYNKELSICE